MTTTCLNCGARIDDGEDVCPACGVRRRSHIRAPGVWMGRAARHRSAAVGIVIAVIVAVFLVWYIATQGQGLGDVHHVVVQPPR